MNLISRLPCLIAAAAIILFPSDLRSQETDADPDAKSPILMRVLCKQPVPKFTDLKIVQEEQATHDLKITDSLITDPLKVSRGSLILARQSGDPEKPVFEPVIKLTIPTEGKRFVLALFSSPSTTPGQAPYQFRLVRTDNLRFGASDLYLFNLTTLPIGGTLGTTKFTLAPNQSEVATPKPDQPGGRMYQTRFYHRIEQEVKIFNDTRWPLSLSARIYLFFIPDPERNSIGYLSFREYEPFP